jgi:hypothetical protein
MGNDRNAHKDAEADDEDSIELPRLAFGQTR